MDVYCLDGNIIRNSVYAELWECLRNLDYEKYDNGTYMKKGEFIMYEIGYSSFKIALYPPRTTYYVYVRDYGEYTELMPVNKHIESLMDIDSLSHEEILANMRKLREFIIQLVDCISNCCDNFGRSSTKSAAR